MSQQPFLLQRGEWQVSGSLDPKPASAGPEVPGDLGQSPRPECPCRSVGGNAVPTADQVSWEAMAMTMTEAAASWALTMCQTLQVLHLLTLRER